MAKSKKKKQKTQDFQKIKLKVGKKKPRGLNETVATFKSRSINIKEQLKEVNKAETTTKRKLNLQEVLCQCQHYSPSVRHEGLFGLKELVSQNSALLHSNLAQILERVSSMIVDKDGTVRSSLCKLFKTLFALVSTNQIAPFFSVLAAHLCCAMTHIHDDIQMDSLKLLDLCVDSYPSLVTNHSRQILPNFVEQISRQTQTAKGSESKPRTLLVNPNSKLSSQRGRIQVLQRLHKFFQALVRYTSTSGDCDVRANSSVKEYAWCPEKPLHVKLFPAQHAAHSSLKLGSYSGSLSSSRSALSEEDLTSYTDMLVPLLIECWTETSPAQLATNMSGNALSGESVCVLWNVLGILQLLLQLCRDVTQLERFKERYMRDFVQYFMPHFPYARHEEIRVKGKRDNRGKEHKNNSFPTISILTLNLELCQVMSHFVSTSHDKTQSKTRLRWQTTVLEFLLGLEKCDLDREQVVMATSVIQTIIQADDFREKHEPLLRLMYGLYVKRLRSKSADLSVFLEFFGTAALHYGKNCFTSKTLSSWICSLPRALSRTMKLSTTHQDKSGVLRKLLALMTSFAARKHDKFLHHLDRLLFNTLLSDPGLRLLKQLNVSEQCQVIQLLHWIPILDKLRLSKVARLCADECLHPSIMRIVMEIIGRQLDNALSEQDEGLPGDSSGDSGYAHDSGGELYGFSVDTDDSSDDSDDHSGDAHKEVTSKAQTGSRSRHDILEDFLSFVMTGVIGPRVQHAEGNDCTDQLLNIPFSRKRVILSEHCQSSSKANHQILVTRECTRMLELCCTPEPIEKAILAYVIKFWNSVKAVPLSAAISVLYVSLSAIRRYGEGAVTIATSQCSVDRVDDNAMDYSNSDGENRTHTIAQDLTIFLEYSDLKEVLADACLTIAAALVAIETGRVPAKQMPASTRTQNKQGTDTTDFSNCENKQERNDSDTNKVRDTPQLVENGFRVCRECLNITETMRQSFVHLVINRCSGSITADNVELATRLLSALILPNCPRKAEVQLLRDFVHLVNQRLTVSQQYWTDFVYKVSLLKEFE